MSEVTVHHLESSTLQSRSVHLMAADGSQKVQSGATRTFDTPIQRGFARHCVMLAPMTVKNTPITMTIAAQPITWIVAIAPFEILERMSRLSTGKHLRGHV
jgi:hypothetical protein